MLFLSASGALWGADPAYEAIIKPLFRERCYACHGALKQKAGLRVDTAKEMLRADVVLPGNPGKSELFLRVTSQDDDERMPPEGHHLSKDQIEAIARWIKNGAEAPANELPEDDPLEHWAFKKIEKPGVPKTDREINPVDAFLNAKHRELGLRTQPPADRSLAIRRLYLDLLGLPPTPEQLETDATWENIVDQLLASPHHGERWGRHWMDIWRYSEWYGLGAQLRYSQKHIWHWRDWIVESLNEDKGYDQMVREMLAGDEIAPSDSDTLRATGFLARNYYLFNRTTWLDTTVEHTGKAFLGLTLNCAKCHDHKYDPIGMEDYYTFRAIFEPHQVRLDPLPGFPDLEKNGLPRVFDDQLEAVTYLHRRGDPSQPDKSKEIQPAVPEFLSAFAPAIQEIELPLAAFAPGSQSSIQEDRLKEARDKLAAAERRLKEAPRKPASTSEHFRPVYEKFSSLDHDTWELTEGGLEFRDGALRQAQSTRSPGYLISRQAMPRDFEFTCSYTVTGGSTFRSISFRIDRDTEGKNANYIYTSEHARGPKVQAAYTRNGKNTYPSEGRASKKVTIGKPQTLRVAVRGTLLNAWLDDQFVLAYRFPNRIDGGKFSLSGFDATVTFHSLDIRELPADFKFTEAKNAKEEILELAALEFEAAKAELAAVEATIAADRFRYAHFSQGKTNRQLEKTAATRQAEAKLVRAQAMLASGDAKKKKQATADQKKAREQLAAIAEGGDFHYEPLKVARKALETPAHKFEDYPAEFSPRSTGRRTMLANWITSPENPLTARVAVNHVWMRHFGEPLVDTVFDFGRQAKRPRNAGLLDYLAAEFIESGWSFRHLHRLLVTSDAYQRSSSTLGADPNTLTIDPNNHYYWRGNSRRMESQVVRDSLLYLSGQLDLSMIGGPSINPKSKSKRRSLYFTHSPDKLDRFVTTFDDADLQQCYRRNESVVPQQALALYNSDLSFISADKLAVLLKEAESVSDFVDASFTTILARAPEPGELNECLSFLDEIDDERRARVQLIHALFNHNDFITIR